MFQIVLVNHYCEQTPPERRSCQMSISLPQVPGKRWAGDCSKKGEEALMGSI